MNEYPQIQTQITEYGAPLTTYIDAPWVAVTSVNGMTGDVIVEVQMNDFQPYHYYQKGTAVIYNGKLYYAKANFNSSTSFNANDWYTPDFDQVQADWNTINSNTKSYIKNKPTKLSQFTNDQNFQTATQVNSLITSATSGLQTQINTLDTTFSKQISDLDSTITQNFNTLSNKIDNKVDKEAGKGLSEVNFTQTEKDKLAGLANIKSIGSQLSFNSNTGVLDGELRNTYTTATYAGYTAPYINSQVTTLNNSITDVANQLVWHKLTSLLSPSAYTSAGTYYTINIHDYLQNYRQVKIVAFSEPNDGGGQIGAWYMVEARNASGVTLTTSRANYTCDPTNPRMNTSVNGNQMCGWWGAPWNSMLLEIDLYVPGNTANYVPFTAKSVGGNIYTSYNNGRIQASASTIYSLKFPFPSPQAQHGYVIYGIKK